jgi:hypothetical protein
MMPERTGNWIDPLGEDQYNALKAVNLTKHNQSVIQLKIDGSISSTGASQTITGCGTRPSRIWI